MNIWKLLKRHKPNNQVIPTDLEERWEITLSGSGGQGVIFAGRLLGEAASIYDNKEAVMTQSYGPEARGGASKAEIIISSQAIEYPKVTNMDVLLVMTQEALDKYGGLLNTKSLLIADETFVKQIPSHIKNVFKAPFVSLAIKLFDAPIVANIIAMGSLAAITRIVSREALIQAVLAGVPDKILVLDRVAVDTGFKIAEDANFQWSRTKEGLEE